MTHWGDAGFGTDPEGDAARRAELESVRVDPDALVEHLREADRLGILAAPEQSLAAAIRRTAHIVPPSPDEVIEVLGAEVVEQLDDGPYADVPAGYFVREDPDYGEVLVPIPEPEPDPHAVTRTAYGSSVAIVCACGRWECIVTGPSSARWAGADHARHVRDEETGRVD